MHISSNRRDRAFYAAFYSRNINEIQIIDSNVTKNTDDSSHELLHLDTITSNQKTFLNSVKKTNGSSHNGGVICIRTKKRYSSQSPTLTSEFSTSSCSSCTSSTSSRRLQPAPSIQERLNAFELFVKQQQQPNTKTSSQLDKMDIDVDDFSYLKKSRSISSTSLLSKSETVQSNDNSNSKRAMLNELYNSNIRRNSDSKIIQESFSFRIDTIPTDTEIRKNEDNNQKVSSTLETCSTTKTEQSDDKTIPSVDEEHSSILNYSKRYLSKSANVLYNQQQSLELVDDMMGVIQEELCEIRQQDRDLKKMFLTIYGKIQELQYHKTIKTQDCNRLNKQFTFSSGDLRRLNSNKKCRKLTTTNSMICETHHKTNDDDNSYTETETFSSDVDEDSGG
ncbi:unnamed protein product [Didymodactylos carnosus]|uniref:Uncharacterized protein n=1 Tax=Didymodactylos carnosus TaxID=1234261 RepID=A0A814EGM5_9BILA|nr:unnamed protein product [Didymodactylos carnosus]CAF1406245.1 unnamed protein product [Didymodactylos carnosus]CAF3741045.1 unnamed protein product [Didymodactylos carnosus]CAF4211661.1 unnamed protein product [Didymodactylos carnosus]